MTLIVSQEFRLDTRELTCKLSGLEIGSGRSNDSGVASPSEEGENTERARSKASKSRTQSGEDPGLGGSEQGEWSGHHQMSVAIIIIC